MRGYTLPMRIEFTVRIEQDAERFAGSSPRIPGACRAGQSLEEQGDSIL